MSSSRRPWLGWQFVGPKGIWLSQLSVEVANATANPRVVVCVHGLSRQGRDFDTLATSLAGEGVRVVAPDIPGRGRSAWLPVAAGYGYPVYLGVMAALIARYKP